MNEKPESEEKDNVEDHRIDFRPPKEPIHPDNPKNKEGIKDYLFMPDIDGVEIEQIGENTSEKPASKNWKTRLKIFLKSILKRTSDKVQ